MNRIRYQTNINLLQPQALPESPLPEKPKKKWIFWLFLAVIVLFVGGYIIKQTSLANWPEDPSQYDPVTLKPKKVSLLQTVKNMVFRSGDIVQGENDDRINILLLGMGGAGHDGPYLTDTNIIVSLKPSTKEIAMISVPRDLGTEINGYGVRKINFANSYGEAQTAGQGGEFARKIFEKTFSLDIPYYVRVDFKAFEEMIDAVGGLKINVQNSFVDTQFPGEGVSYKTVNFPAGEQTMNGVTALEYARSRHGNNGEGSDFARSRRQQQILTALKEKLLSFGTYTNPLKVQQLLRALSNHITTNLNFGQIMYLSGLVRDSSDNIKMFVIDDSVNGYLHSGITSSGAYMLFPKTGNFNSINQTIKDIFSTEIKTNNTTTETTKKNEPIFPTGKIEIQNGTWRAGLAAKWQVALQEKGFTMLAAGNSIKRPIDKTTIYVLKSNVSKEILDALTKEVPGSIENTIPTWLTAPVTSSESSVGYNKEADILIILGTDIKE